MALPSIFTVFLLSMWLFCSLKLLTAQSPLSSIDNSNARNIDALLQDYAFQVLVLPRTGIIYDGVAPSNLPGIQVSALRLRTGSLRTKGVVYKEFEIPIGLIEHPYVERLVLVYQNMGNWSMTYYPLQGYTYLVPVLGLLAYDAFDLTGRNLPELDIQASDPAISIHFRDLGSVPDGLVTQCVFFYLNGSVSFSNVSAGNICSTFRQGHFAIVVKSIVPSPVTPPPPGDVPGPGRVPSGGVENNTKVGIIVGSVIGGFGLLVIFGVLAFWVRKYKGNKKMHKMERAAEIGEVLKMTSLGRTKAPAATGTRTQPSLESEYVP